MQELAQRLLGVWRVQRFDDRDLADEEWRATYGPSVDGLVTYAAPGWVTVQVTDGEDRYDAYFGRFVVIEIADRDGALSGMVEHHVVASSMPELLTADPTRPFRISGDRLVLGDERTWRRICERVG